MGHHKDNWTKKIIWAIFISVLGLLTISISTWYFSEKYVEIISATEIKDDTIILKLHNDASRHSTPSITIYGLLGDEEKIIKKMDNQILEPGENLDINISIKKINKTYEIIIEPVGSMIWHSCSEISPEFLPSEVYSPQLFYRIECDGCDNQKKWKYIKMNSTLQPWIRENLLDSRTICTLNYVAYKWDIVPGATLIYKDIVKEKHLEIWVEEEPENTSGLGYTCSYNAYDCGDFNTHTEAQAVFEACGGVSNDVHRLDGDGDGIACEWLP